MKHQFCNSAPCRPAHAFPGRFSVVPTWEVAGSKKLWALALCLLATAVLTGCASTTVTGRQRYVNEKLPRPGQIVIYDFAATPADVPEDSMFASQAAAPSAPATEEQLGLGRQLGTSIATQLILAIRTMGLPAERGGPDTKLQVNDIVIRGYLVSVEKGKTGARMVVGFGAGGSELETAIEGYQMTATGLRKVGSATLRSESSKGPGASLGAAGWLITGSPIGLIAGGGMKIYGEASGSATIEGRAKQTAKEIAKKLKIRFQEEGWIQ